ncbi:MAG: type II secretion system secretin GspD [Rhodocyclales bacterium]|nr:type II secretion system secretin GspD [Rhodocyclales bacterium]
MNTIDGINAQSMRKLPQLALTALCAVMLGGCAGLIERDDGVANYLRDAASGRDAAPPPSAAARTAAVEAPPERAAEAVIVRGSGTMLAPGAAQRKAVEQHGDTVSLEFSQAPLVEVVQALLGDLLKLNISIEQAPEGTVSLRTGSPIPRDSVLPIVESMLQSNGAALVRDAQGVYRIASQAGIRQQANGLYRPESLPPGYGMVVVPLRYVGAVEMAEILKPVAPPEAIVRVDAVRNLLILSGSRGQHEGWLEIVRSFDVDYLKGMSLGIFPLEYASIDDVFDTVGAMLGSQRGAGGEGGNVTAAAVRLFPIKRLNSLVVVSPRAEHLDTVREWVQRLDQPALNDLEPRLYVYPVQNGSASHLAELLSSLYGDANAASSQRKADSGVAPGLKPTTLTSAAKSASSGTTTGTASTVTMPDTDAAAGALTTKVSLGEQVKVVADEQNNALLILAPRKDYRKIEAALRQLDLAPTQVLIEASIIEVSLTGDLKYGLEWTFNGRLGGSYTGTGLLNLNESGEIGAAQPGFSYAVTGGGANVSAVLNALAQKSLLRVLSSPSVLVQDNHTATIHVGDQRPVKSGETVSTTGNLSTSTITYRDTGVMLSVTPSANAGGLVTMSIHQSVTDVGNIDEASGQRTFLQREIKSRVSVRTGETIVMGGLMRESNSGGRSGVPVLHELPLVGDLFGSTSEEKRRTELLVLITPRVIANDAELRAVSDEIRGRMHATLARPAPAHQ